MSAGRKRVVFIDDSALILDMTRATLEALDLDVATAIDLAQLEAVLAEAPADLLLIDVNMPEAYGDDLGDMLRHLRSLTVPIYLFSDLADEELARRTVAAGVDGYVSKRGGFEGLVRRVSEILSLRGVP